MKEEEEAQLNEDKKLKKTHKSELAELKALEEKTAEVKVRINELKALIEEEDEKIRAMFLISVMCVRRFNEILGIEYKDIIDGIVNVRGITTKTFKSQGEKVVERYPLPDEVLNIIGNGKGKVFTYDYQKYQERYAKMIDIKCNLDLKELGKEYKIRSHDNRHFIMSIASEKYGSETVGKLALSHRSINSINDVYLSVEYKRVEKLFKWYWKILRKEETV